MAAAEETCRKRSSRPNVWPRFRWSRGQASLGYNESPMSERYEPKSIEEKWRRRWKEADLFRTEEDPSKPKFYGLEFFPYPSGAGLSVGHCRNYIPTDVICRYKKMCGYNVLHPMGFDAFGLPAENEAIAKQTHPAPMVRQYGENYRRQLDLVGSSYDWSRTVYSSDPTYYRWTQWIFQLLFKRGLAYQKLASVNWCPKDATVLADEEVEAGRCWRCGTLVEKKQIPQWFMKITAYAERLLSDLDELDWPEGIKMMQRNWIGKSSGVQFSMKVAIGQTPPSHTIEVFTTRIDTLFGVTFAVIAPEHPLIAELIAQLPEDRRSEIEAYQLAARQLSDIDRQATTHEKTGVQTGLFAINPATGSRIPIFIADYVLMGYGTGAIMAVPGHDQRDFDFALKYGLEVVPVIEPNAEYLAKFDGASLEAYLSSPRAFSPVFDSKDAVLVNSGEYSGLSVEEAQEKLGVWIEALEIGKRVVNYRLRDWLISRQRYWGCPFPIIHSKEGETQLVPESELPVLLPDVDNYQPAGDGSSPLSTISDFVNVTDLDGRLGRRETDTMGGFACSSWYFLRFCDPHNDQFAFDPEKVKYWMPVDCYVGGAEHAVMHLLYARFWTKVLYDEGLVPVKEPFKKLMNQGQVLANTPYRKPLDGERLQVGEDGILCSFEEAKEYEFQIADGKLPKDFLFYRWARMSKSKGNVVTPDEMVESFGADSLRIYELFVAPFESDVQWSNDGVAGASRFLARVYRFVGEVTPLFDQNWKDQIGSVQATDASTQVRRRVHQTIQRATEDIEGFAFNTYVSELMKCLNDVSDALKSNPAPDQAMRLALSEAAEAMVLLLAPAAPFVADELWESLGQIGFTYNQAWPGFDSAIAKEDRLKIAVQVNGKLRDTFEATATTSNQDLEATALGLPKIVGHLEGLTIRKVIVVPGKLVNVVAN